MSKLPTEHVKVSASFDGFVSIDVQTVTNEKTGVSFSRYHVIFDTGFEKRNLGCYDMSSSSAYTSDGRDWQNVTREQAIKLLVLAYVSEQAFLEITDGDA